MKQIALDIGLARGPTLASFCAGPNEAAHKHLQLWAGSPTRSPVPTYLWGEGASGKTHLLMAVQHALREQGASVGWLDAAMLEPPEFDERWAAVLRQEADARGVFLGDEVMDFMLTRFSRDLGSLMQLLDQLDGYALQTKRAITIPLIKSMLESE